MHHRGAEEDLIQQGVNLYAMWVYIPYNTCYEICMKQMLQECGPSCSCTLWLIGND